MGGVRVSVPACASMRQQASAFMPTHRGVNRCSPLVPPCPRDVHVAGWAQVQGLEGTPCLPAYVLHAFKYINLVPLAGRRNKDNTIILYPGDASTPLNEFPPAKAANLKYARS